HADTGADAVHFEIDAGDGDLGPVTGFTSNGLDLDDALLDLRDLIFKESANEVGVGTRQDDLDTLPGLLDRQDDGLDTVADVVRLAGDLFAARQDRFGLSQADDGRAALVPLHGTMNQVTLHGGVFVEDSGRFGLADLLNHHLLGALGNDPPEVRRVEK